VLEVRGLTREYAGKNGGGPLQALLHVDFSVAEGEFLSLVGPSGCGKSTLLMCIAWLMAPSGGEVLLDGRPVTAPPPEMVLIFQNYTSSLFPWRTVLQNVLFGLEGKGMAKAERRGLAMQTLAGVGLERFAGMYPWQLSGGMQQRVAIARGLAYGAPILLMDEPFASVDAQTRTDLEDLLLGVWRDFGKTVLFVTHDIDEAVYLSDRVIVLSGRPAQVAETIAIDLPRPRHQLDSRALPRFAQLRADIYGLLKSRPADTAACPEGDPA